jgi:lysophospholipase L1-like esterase
MRIVMRVLRLAGHVLVAGLCLELAARLDDRLSHGAPFWSRYDAGIIRSTDAEGLVRNVPGARFEKWQINALGFRGEAIALEKPAGRRRIACLGQSESFGLYEREGGEWPARLARLLSANHRDAEVINASVVGLGRDMRQRYIDKYVLPLRPDVLVLYFNVLSDASHRTEPARRGASAASPAPTLVSPRAPLPSSRVLPKLSRRVRAAIPDRIWNPVRAWRLARTVQQKELTTLGDRPPLDVLPPEAIASFEHHLRAIISAQRERGVAPVLATYPTLGSAANRSQHRLEFLTERVWHAEFSDLGMIDAAAKLNDTVRRVARELAVPMADLDAAIPKTAEYFADYVHYTDAGAELAASNVLAALERGGVLDGPPQAKAGRGEAR